MPEGPQARQVANIIETFAGVDLVEINHPKSRVPWELELPVQIERARTIGKNIFIELSNGQVIYNHLLMWGWWLPTCETARGGRLKSKRLNTCFHFADGRTLGYFGGGVLKLISQREADQKMAWLGPDIMNSLSGEQAFARLMKSDLSIGEALLAQNLVAGIGNVYKSEGMFVARLNPFVLAKQVSAADYERLWRWLKPQMVGDIKRPGKMVTTSREAAKAGNRNFVYRRLGQPCLLCNTKIMRVYQGEKLPRSTYYCPRCQMTNTG